MKYLHTFKSRGFSDIPHRTFGDCRQEQNDHGICREEQIHGGTSTALARRGCQTVNQLIVLGFVTIC
jgi:hypothetical protein